MNDHGYRIAVLDRGFVFVGKVMNDDEFTYIEEAQSVRVWGTTKGLGQLAKEGPQQNTKLDPCPNVKVSNKAVLFLMECDRSKFHKCSCCAGEHKP